jgi:hypothetical protein
LYREEELRNSSAQPILKTENNAIVQQFHDSSLGSGIRDREV